MLSSSLHNIIEKNANSADPDQTDLGLHCLPGPICPENFGYYSTL